MFTGIIETLGRIVEVQRLGSNRVFRIESSIAPQLTPDQSVAHNGVCLTVENIEGSIYQVTAIAETLAKTDLGHWVENRLINLERSMTMSKLLDGHLVQGHVDCAGKVLKTEALYGSRQFTFGFDPSFAKLIVEKGSIAVNGISLTAFNVGDDAFTIAAIPYTLEHTNLKTLEEGDAVNLEFDIIGKYVLRQTGQR